MIIRKLFSGLAVLTLFLFTSFVTHAQKDSIQREVEVVKAYTPTIMDAEKINEMPVIKDEVFRKPDFNYSIDSNPVFSALSVKDLQAATILGKPAEKPGFGMVRAGIGNYNKPYGELFFNNPKGKNSVFGLHGKHLSSHSKLNLANGDRVKAPFSEDQAEMFMKYMIGKSTLSINLGIDHHSFRYYGYPGKDTIPAFLNNLPQSSQNFSFQDWRQAFTRGGININLQNIIASKSDPSTGFDFRYYRFGTRTGQREDYLKFEMNLRRPKEGFYLTGEAGAEYSNVTNIYSDILEAIPLSTHRGQTWIFFKPAVYLGNETINLKAGIKTWLVAGLLDKVQFKITPNIRFNFAPVKEIINVFAGVDGEYFHNHYSAIAYQNPFVTPTLCVNNHLEKYRIFGGFDGKLTSKTNFKIQVDQSAFSKHPFYYLVGFRVPSMGPKPGPAYVYNTFMVLYDDMKTLKFNGEITHNIGDKFNLLVNANIYKYTMSEEENAWNLPGFDANLSLNYAITERLTVAVDFYMTGKRNGLFAQTNASQNPTIQWEAIKKTTTTEIKTYVMDMAVDMNLRGTYDISRKFAIFAQLNNFGFQKYERWLGYPVQSFNFLGGFSYSF
jgi:hypothetical protein